MVINQTALAPAKTSGMVQLATFVQILSLERTVILASLPSTDIPTALLHAPSNQVVLITLTMFQEMSTQVVLVIA
jgi:hypothetical protein